MLELLNQVVREHAMLDLINGFAGLIGDRLDAAPNEQGTGNVIATSVGGQMHLPAKLSLNSRFSALTSLNTR
jgi:hypothetical protein